MTCCGAHVGRLLQQRQYFGRQSWFLQSEPVLCRQRCRTHALSGTPRSPPVAAAPDMWIRENLGAAAVLIWIDAREQFGCSNFSREESRCVPLRLTVNSR